MGTTGSWNRGVAEPTRVVGYMRVSTEKQEYGIEAQRTAIAAHADSRCWEVTWLEDSGRSGKHIERPGIQHALALLKAGEADALVVSKLDRLSRSLADFAALLSLARKQGWGAIALDLGIDTTTPTGELVANIMAAVANWERQMIGIRTKDALAEAKKNGVRLGSPVLIPDAVAGRIAAERREGRSLRAIADGLNADLTPLAGPGRCWYASTVRGVLGRLAA